jgi:hypothetical protein
LPNGQDSHERWWPRALLITLAWFAGSWATGHATVRLGHIGEFAWPAEWNVRLAAISMGVLQAPMAISYLVNRGRWLAAFLWAVGDFGCVVLASVEDLSFLLLILWAVVITGLVACSGHR